MFLLKPDECKRCGKVLIDSIHTCTPTGVDDGPKWGRIEYRADGTQRNIKTKENPNNILRQTKKRGIKKR